MNIEERLAKLEQTVAEMQKHLEGKREAEFVTPDFSKLSVSEYSNVLKGLAHPMRVTLLTKIAEGGKYHNELAEITGLGPAPLSFHLGGLRSAGLIAQETIRGKYIATEIGLSTLSFMARLAEKLSHFEVVELDRYCLMCGQAKMKVAMFSNKFQAWCPACGEHEQGPPHWKWTMTGFNPYGEDWRHHDIDDLVDEGWKSTFELLKESVKERKCTDCSSKMDYTVEDGRTFGRCPACGGFHDMTTKYGMDWAEFLPLWRKYKRIRQNVEGPIIREGIQCWKVTINTEDGQHKIIQYIRTKTGEVIETIRE